MCKVSVIIPSYGIPDYLEKAINSVRNQTLLDWELIVVDDNNPKTTDRIRTEELLNKIVSIDKRIIYIKHDRNRNGAVARNTGFSVAKGKYIALLDSDDEYMPDRLMKCYKALESASYEVAGVYTGCEFRRSGKKYHIETNVKSGNFLKETLACTFRFCTGSNIFVRKSVVDELNGFDPTFLRHQDYEFLVRIFQKYNLLAIPEVLVIKNNEGFNVPNIEKAINIKKQYLNKFENVISNFIPEERNYIYQRHCVAIAEAAMRRNNFSLATIYYKKAQSYERLTLHDWVRRITYPVYNLFN